MILNSVVRIQLGRVRWKARSAFFIVFLLIYPSITSTPIQLRILALSPLLVGSEGAGLLGASCRALGIQLDQT